jgi:hypothetical protein
VSLGRVMSSYLKLFKEKICQPNKWMITDVKTEDENSHYSGVSFNLNSMSVQFRVSKVTPKKNGEFVTFYKRQDNGIIAPYDSNDNIDFYIIMKQDIELPEYFIMPKKILCQYDILSINGIGGKRGFRLYTPDDIVTSIQAQKTQAWQKKCYLDLNDPLIAMTLVAMSKVCLTH